MKALLIDAGNSRIKWCVMRGTRLARIRAASWNARTLRSVAVRIMRDAAGVEAVLVCSVATPGVDATLRTAAARSGAPRPTFVPAEHEVAGVINGYKDPWRLGVDRWVALVGARHGYPGRALCIADVGTAMTVDLLDSRGRHRGGAIVPGPHLMVSALLANTAQIKRRAGRLPGGTANAPSRLFATDTGAGLKSGAAHACAGLIVQAMQQARTLLRRRPLLLLAGGGAGVVAPLLKLSHRRVDDLVLRGLAVLAQSSAS